MWKWLRSWFGWRFSLIRLVVAVVFLGVFVGLNVQKIGPMRSPPANSWDALEVDFPTADQRIP